MVLNTFGMLRGPIILVSFSVPHMKVEVCIEIVVLFSVVGWSMDQCQQSTVDNRPKDLMFKDGMAMLAHRVCSSNYLCQDFPSLVGYKENHAIVSFIVPFNTTTF